MAHAHAHSLKSLNKKIKKGNASTISNGDLQLRCNNAECDNNDNGMVLSW